MTGGNSGGSVLQAGRIDDPRLTNDFDPALFPTADGLPLPPTVSDERDDKIKFDFCTVYYHLNILHAQLSRMRKNPADLASGEHEREILLKMEKYLRRRDELEDRFAPCGVIAEAQAKDGFTVNIKFTFGDHNILREQRSKLIKSSAMIFFDEPLKEESPERVALDAHKDGNGRNSIKPD